MLSLGVFLAEPTLWRDRERGRGIRELLVHQPRTLCQISEKWKVFCTKGIAGNFRGVLIFVILVVDQAVTKFSTHENLFL